MLTIRKIGCTQIAHGIKVSLMNASHSVQSIMGATDKVRGGKAAGATLFFWSVMWRSVASIRQGRHDNAEGDAAADQIANREASTCRDGSRREPAGRQDLVGWCITEQCGRRSPKNVGRPKEAPHLAQRFTLLLST